MTLEINTKEKTITAKGRVNLGALVKELKKMNIDINEYSLISDIQLVDNYKFYPYTPLTYPNTPFVYGTTAINCKTTDTTNADFITTLTIN